MMSEVKNQLGDLPSFMGLRNEKVTDKQSTVFSGFAMGSLLKWIHIPLSRILLVFQQNEKDLNKKLSKISELLL